MELLIKAGGVYFIGLTIFHILFWKIFDWPRDLQSLSFLNRAIMQALNVSLTFVFVVFAYLSFAHTQELLETALGNSLLFFIGALLLFRAIQQIVFFKLKHWGSVAFALIFLTGAVLYAVPAFYVRL